MKRILLGAAAALALAAPAYADGTRISIAPFQSRQAWQANWDTLNQRGNDAGAQWECHGDHECNLYFIVKPGVKAHLATERYGRGYCYIVEGAETADCYREDGKKSVWTLDKPFDYGLAPQSPTPEVAQSAPPAPASSQPDPDRTAPVPATRPADAYSDEDVYKCAKASPVYNDAIAFCRASYKMYEDLARAIPQWSQVNTSLAFANWLDQVDPATHRTRRSALMEAHNANDTTQVISIFKSFIDAPPAPTAAPTSAGVHIALGASGGGLQSTSVMLGSTTSVIMAIDTGCSYLSVSDAVADQLLANGEATDNGVGKSVWADNKEHDERRIIIKSVMIGGKTITNVPASVGGAMLFGVGALRMLGKFSVGDGELVLG